MKTGWQRRQLGELAELKGRIGWRGLTAKEYTKEGPLFLSVHSLNHGDYVDFSEAFHISEARYAESPEIMLQENDVLICKDGAGIGKVGIVGKLPGRATINSSLLLVRAGGEIEPKFLYRCLSSPYFQEIVNSRLNGATTPHLYQRDIAEFPVVLPPLPEQQRVITILDKAFEAIDTVKANAEKNLRNARALFESHLQTVFTGKGGGWRVATLDQIAKNLDSKRIPITKSDRKSGEYRYYGASGVVDYVEDYIFDCDALLVSEDGANLLARSTPIAFSVSGKYWVNNHAHILQFEEMATQRFVEYYLESIKLDPYVTGAAQPKLNQKALNSIPIPIPRLLEDRAEIVKNLEMVQAETKRLAAIYARKLAALEELKKSFLHQAFIGQLTADFSETICIHFPVEISGISITDLHAGILAMAYRAHERGGKLDRLTKVKVEKISHMIEAWAGIELGRKPVKDYFGPNDTKHLKGVEHRAKMTKCFSFHKDSDGGERIRKLGNFDALLAKTEAALGERQQAVEELLTLMLPMSYQQAEIFTTVHAAWNNLLLNGQEATDEAIVTEARENWHPEKLKIERGKFFRAIEWIREKEMVPPGQGKFVGSKVQV